MFEIKQMPKMSVAVLSIMISTAIGHAAVIYVDDSAAGKNTGASWIDAYVDLQNGLAAAQSGDEIHIGQGLYKPAGPNGDRTISFHLVNGVLVQGGYAGAGSPDPDALDPRAYPTVLSGDLNGDDGPNETWTNYDENSLHVVVADGLDQSAPLRGVTVRSGCANLDFSENHAGGVLVVNSILVITDCIIEDNQAITAIGGLYASTCVANNCIVRRNRTMGGTVGGGGLGSGAGSKFTNCTFEKNKAPEAGSAGALSTGNSTIDSCLFINNSAVEDGGAIFGSNLTITESTFVSNGCGVYGGVIRGSNCTFTNCQFMTNFGGAEGGAIYGSNFTLSGCAFKGCQSSAGGAISTQGTSTVVDCTFDENKTFVNNGYNAGAILNGGMLDVVNCAFRGNFSQLYGGAIDNHGTLNAVNSLFSGNTTKDNGGAINNFAIATLTNCTIVGNSALLGQQSSASGALHNLASGQIQIRNCILWDNSAGGQSGQSNQIYNAGGSVMVNDSCIMGWDNSLGGANNFGNDPQMINPKGPDNAYGTPDDNPRLSPRSPCRDEGNNSFLPHDQYDLDHDGNSTEIIPVDLDLLPRIVSDIVDLGAFEFQAAGCPADVAPLSGGDGEINVDDLLAVINNWGACSPPDRPTTCPSDITNDGVVNVDDLLFVLSHWGACP